MTAPEVMYFRHKHNTATPHTSAMSLIYTDTKYIRADKYDELLAALKEAHEFMSDMPSTKNTKVLSIKRKIKDIFHKAIAKAEQHSTTEGL